MSFADISSGAESHAPLPVPGPSPRAACGRALRQRPAKCNFSISLGGRANAFQNAFDKFHSFSIMNREAEKCKKQLETMRKEPGNKRCANCASMSVPYVCLDFGTFVCTRCSALHRDMCHRVKSITAAKFTPAEVATIRGNAYDAQMYLANWNEGLFKLPGAGNEDTERAKEFMQIKYVEKRWASDAIRPQVQV